MDAQIRGLLGEFGLVVPKDVARLRRELPSILDCAQESFLTSEPNPTYASTAIKVDDLISRRMLRDLKIEQDDAVRWGKRLRKVTGDMVAEDSEHPVVVSTA